MRALPLFISAMLTSAVTPAADLARPATLTREGAQHVIEQATTYARAHSAPGAAVAVVDAGGLLVALDRLDGTFPAAASISIGKARTAALFRKPTRVFEDLVNKGRYTMTTLPDVTPFTPLQGGVPIVIDGEVVGAVGVSGASSAQQDDEIAQAAADGFVQQHAAAQAAVTYVPSAVVSEAFRQDANLVTGDAYRVNASRRDGPGEAEVHVHDTDIFYVREGTAVLVTGGAVVQPRQVSPTEVRGAAIDGGTERHIGPGDVITIPSGVPHWFKSVEQPFTYYVVKSATSG
ncbi:MAG TPA: heme-binding protein [Steroidobacteraceae bacterium]